MRFLTLDLQKFGPFTGVVLDLSQNPRALHLIVGSNAAGKSTSLRATIDLLFGIPAKTRDAHLHEMPDLRIGGRLSSEDGHVIDLVRRKGNTKTLLDPAGQTIDEGTVTKLLGGLGREQFEGMFGLSHQSLIDGGRALLEGKGNVGASLFSAGLGGLGIHHLLQRLEEKAETIFKPRGNNPPLNRAIAAYKEAKRSAADESLKTKDWEALQEDLKAQRALSQKIDAELQTLRFEERRLRRIHAALGPVAHRQEIQQQLAEHSHVLVLPEKAAEERRAAQTVLADAASDSTRLESEIHELRTKSAAISVPDELLSRDAAMKQLRNDLGGHLKAASDLPRRRAEMRGAEEDARSLLRQLGSEISMEEIETLRLKTNIETRASALGKQCGKLESALSAARHQQTEIEEKLRTQRKKRDSLAEPVSADRLRRAADMARKDGDVEKRMREQHIAFATMHAALTRGHTSLGLWSGPPESIGSLPVPDVESIARFEKSASEIGKELAKVATRTDDRQTKMAQIEEDLDTLKRSTAVPTEEDLAATRREREQTWSQVRRAWLEPRASPEANAAGPALAAEHEDRTRAADEVADRLRREADRVAKLASLEASRATEERELVRLGARRTKLEGERQDDAGEWRALWAPLGIEPLSPSEMRTWLVRYHKLADDRTRWLDASRALDDLRRQVATHRKVLGAELAASGRASTPQEGEEGEGETLGVLAARAEDLVKQADALTREHSGVTESILALESDATRTKGTVEQHVSALEEWKRQWTDVTAALGLTVNALPEEAEKVIEQRKELLSKAEALKSLRHRVQTMEDDARAFAARVDDLVRTAAPDLADRNVEQRAEALLERFDAGGKHRVERAALTQREQRAVEELATLERKREQAHQQIGRLVTTAGCASAADLPDAERRSEVVRELRRKREEVETVLRNVAQGASIEALVTECQGQNADEVFAGLSAREAEIQATEQKRKVPEQEIGRLQARLDLMNGGDRAAVAAENAQHAMASIRTYVEDYARTRLASVLLREEINRYRERNQGPIVSRASELFRTLTLNTFSRLEADYVDEQPVIRCVRSDGRGVAVEGLSDGTRDQLFLALRVASMERHLTHNEPVPVIIDDALINFDDRRARAALSLLGDLASRTQVVFFTHHHHLVDLAAESVAKEALVKHDLDALIARRTA